jgi:putative oxidoreductase
MNIVLWILQVLLAAAFFAHGWLVLAPPPDIAAQMLAALPRWFWVFLGIAEILAAVGLTLPGLTRILPGLVTWSAVGIMIVMVSATVWHIARNEISSALVTLVLLAMATFVAYARYRILPIRARATVTM